MSEMQHFTLTLPHTVSAYVHGFASHCSQNGSQGTKTVEKLSLELPTRLVVVEIYPLCDFFSAAKKNKIIIIMFFLTLRSQFYTPRETEREQVT